MTTASFAPDEFDPVMDMFPAKGVEFDELVSDGSQPSPVLTLPDGRREALLKDSEGDILDKSQMEERT